MIIRYNVIAFEIAFTNYFENTLQQMTILIKKTQKNYGKHIKIIQK